MLAALSRRVQHCLLLVCCCSLLAALPQAACHSLDLPEAVLAGDLPDWLVTRVDAPVTFTPVSELPPSPFTSSILSMKACAAPASPSSAPPSPSPCLVLSNGLISRVFATQPDWGTVDVFSHSAQSSLLRAVTHEAAIVLDASPYLLASLQADNRTEWAYANRSAWQLLSNSSAAWTYASHSLSLPEAPYSFTPGSRHSQPDTPWPPLGLHLTVELLPPPSAPPAHAALRIQLHYEMYQGLPLMAQWLSIATSAVLGPAAAPAAPVLLASVQAAALAVNMPYSPWLWSPHYRPTAVLTDDVLSRLFVSTDQAHGTVVQWQVDAHYQQTPGSEEPVLNVSYTIGPNIRLSSEPGARHSSFTSFRTFLLVTDTVDKERHGLSIRAMTRALTPATTENPIFFHNINATSAGIRYAVDQMAAVGFEMMILSFGTDFDIENSDPQYLLQMAEDIAYANSQGIEVGGYDLVCWTRYIDLWWMQLDPATNRTDESQGACFASGWRDYITQAVVDFVAITGLSAIETDGPYPGYVCSSGNHSHHDGWSDSVYEQTRLQGDFFAALRRLGLFIHQPDHYWFQGSSQSTLGYNEDQFSLPRWTDLSISRQSIFDDTFTYLPTQGWLFLPLVEYHAGGEAAAFEPLSQHMVEYEWALAQYLGSGVAACYRGWRLFDSPEVQRMVTRWVSFYKAHRAILISDLLHLRRADLQDLDYMMHVNPRLNERALLMVYNPTSRTVSNRTLTLPLYYAGLTDSAWVQQEEDISGGAVYQLDRLYQIRVNVSMQPLSITWLLIKADCNNRHDLQQQTMHDLHSAVAAVK